MPEKIYQKYYDGNTAQQGGSIDNSIMKTGKQERGNQHRTNTRKTEKPAAGPFIIKKPGNSVPEKNKAYSQYYHG